MPLNIRRDRPFARTLLLLVGLGSLVIGVQQLQGRLHLLRRGVRTDGHALPRLGHTPASESGAHPDVEFRLPDGRAVRYNQNGMGSRPVGAAIPLLYDPAAPAATAVAASFWQFWLPLLGEAWFAFGFTTAALWGEVYDRGAR